MKNEPMFKIVAKDEKLVRGVNIAGRTAEMHDGRIVSIRLLNKRWEPTENEKKAIAFCVVLEGRILIDSLTPYRTKH